MINKEIFEIVGDLLDTNKPSCLKRYNKVKDYIEILENVVDIIEDNMTHVQDEYINDFPTGNVYIGMTMEDHNKIIELLKKKKEINL